MLCHVRVIRRDAGPEGAMMQSRQKPISDAVYHVCRIPLDRLYSYLVDGFIRLTSAIPDEPFASHPKSVLDPPLGPFKTCRRRVFFVLDKPYLPPIPSVSCRRRPHWRWRNVLPTIWVSISISHLATLLRRIHGHRLHALHTWHTHHRLVHATSHVIHIFGLSFLFFLLVSLRPLLCLFALLLLNVVNLMSTRMLALIQFR